MAATHQRGAKQSQKDARPNQENTACGTTRSGENSFNRRLGMLLAPGHLTPRQTFRKLNVPELVLSLVTIGELQVLLPCVLTSCGIHYSSDVASEMAHCFFKIHQRLLRISLHTIAVTTYARIRRHHEFKLRTLPASCMIYQRSFYVSSISMWNSLTQEAVTTPTAEAFQKAALEVIKSS